jgi:hypothetical protein
MKIDSYSFGRIIINGKLYTSDVIIEVPADDDPEYASPALVPASAPDGAQCIVEATELRTGSFCDEDILK